MNSFCQVSMSSVRFPGSDAWSFSPKEYWTLIGVTVGFLGLSSASLIFSSREAQAESARQCVELRMVSKFRDRYPSPPEFQLNYLQEHLERYSSFMTGQIPPQNTYALPVSELEKIVEQGRKDRTELSRFCENNQ